MPYPGDFPKALPGEAIAAAASLASGGAGEGLPQAVPEPGKNPDPHEAALWQAWTQAGCAQARETLLTLHLPYAHTLAAMVYAQRSADDIAFDDYLQLARVGLLEAFERYRPGQGAQFRTYAARRIRGAILDGLPHHAERYQQAQLAKRLRQERLGSLRGSLRADPAEPEPVADGPSSGDALAQLAEIGLGLALAYLLEGSGLIQVENHEAEWVHAHAPAYAPLALRQRQRLLRSLVRELPAQERKVIERHYLQQQPFEDIATEAGLSKGRISQLHRQALASLRHQLQQHYIHPGDHF